MNDTGREESQGEDGWMKRKRCRETRLSWEEVERLELWKYRLQWRGNS